MKRHRMVCAALLLIACVGCAGCRVEIAPIPVRADPAASEPLTGPHGDHVTDPETESDIQTGPIQTEPPAETAPIETSPVCEHQWETVSHTDGDCRHEGVDHQVCAACGATRDVNDGVLGEHVWSTEWTIDVPATEEAPGERSRHCTNPECDARTDVESFEYREPDLPYIDF
ncbi:MAG: hypothetical protein J6125_03725 [Clostridia bacterium]|nr:hypothetical protein [Clostridia bacterium]